MEIGHWTTIASVAIANAILIIGAYTRQQVKNNDLGNKIESLDRETDIKIDNLKDAMHEHETNNDKAFEKLDKTLDSIFARLNEIADMIRGGRK